MSARRQAAASLPTELLTAGDFARAMVETLREPLLILDEHLTVIFANHDLDRVFGVRPADAVGRPVFELGAGAWDTPELRDLLGRLLPEQLEIRDMRVRSRAPGSGWRELAVNARQVSLEGTERNLILLSITDETEQERLRRELEVYTRRLEGSNRDLRDFAHAASHDLQEPLRKIRLYVQQLRAAIDPAAFDDRTRRQLERLPEAVERMQQRIDDLLLLARLSRQEPERLATNLNLIVASVLEDLEVPLAENAARLSVDELPVVAADPAQMRVLFQNLVSNALKYHAPGQPAVIRIRSLGADGPAHLLAVEDEGIGFEPRHAERIFGAFQRLHGRDEYPGSGVGLALCRRIAELHQGRITAHGTPGSGAVFTVELPRHPAIEEATP